MRRLGLLAVVLLLACGGSGHLVLALEHKPPLRDDPPPAGVTRPVYAVTLEDERGDDENFLCNLGYGDPAGLFARGPRLPFDEACRLL